MKYVVVTGGVVSGLGKGVTASSIGVLLKQCGLRVTSIKIDPYLNIDAGTMSPFEHGEVFVLDDGGEVRFGGALAPRRGRLGGSTESERGGGGEQTQQGERELAALRSRAPAPAQNTIDPPNRWTWTSATTSAFSTSPSRATTT